MLEGLRTQDLGRLGLYDYRRCFDGWMMNSFSCLGF
jgi:hypothetical protein